MPDSIDRQFSHQSEVKVYVVCFPHTLHRSWPIPHVSLRSTWGYLYAVGKADCLTGAMARAEPWGVWGGELLADGVIVPRKRARGRPRKDEAA